MAKCALNPKHWPDLKKAWDLYGHSVKFEDLCGYLLRADGNYIVVAWKEGKHLECADLYRADGLTWEFQNDGSEWLTSEQWALAKIVPDCDEFTYPSDEEMVTITHQASMDKGGKYKAAFWIFEEGYMAGTLDAQDLLEKWLDSETYKTVAKC